VIDHFIHSERVRDAREAAALVRELGATRVRVTQPRTRAWVIKDRPLIARVLAAVEPDAGTLIDIEGITREATAPLLAKLVVAGAQFISIAGTTSTLRVWPRRGEAFVDDRALSPGAAFAAFRDAAAVTWINGHVAEPGPDAVALLPRIYDQLDQPELEIDLDLSVDAALAVTLDGDTELEWTAGAVIQLPSGEIATYQLHPSADFEATWRDRVTAALRRIR
jgi:hypothetical protein